ncbi:heavy metal response regulator transcription factor [Aquincola sp. S2]|uniref:Heavy metal response regulator transcription factor n=1 Tax=Pseudaquabacterium terrae TaxID=2732868 RepID=A0ABX2EI25_9BURK|nr:heavy metal response regulator transcription factor [Aquabacterium terrae]NRF68242.1 heavy metal response regulator transcription factor [Aquabacterium terrae]
MRVLIVEDEPKTAAYIKKGLTEHAFVVDVAGNGLDGLHLATTGTYDLVLLDVMLPGADGWTVLQALRQQRDTPVFFISARDEVADRVKGLELGADDYLVKPFAFSELLARIRTILRRGAAKVDPVVQIADLRIDVVRRRVSRAGQRVELTAKEYALLDYFVRHAGEVVSRTLIAEHVWDMHFDSDTNVVDVAVRRLRAKLDDPFEQKLIHTVRGVGYLFEARGGAEGDSGSGEWG